MKTAERNNQAKQSTASKKKRVRSGKKLSEGEKTVLRLAKEQGVNIKGQLERTLGKGADFWKSDEDLDRFLAEIRARRQEEK